MADEADIEAIQNPPLPPLPQQPKPIEAPPAPAPEVPVRVLAWSGETMGQALSLLHGVSVEEGRLIDRIADQLFGELGNLLRPRMARAMLEEGVPGLARERAAQAQVIALWMRSFSMEEGATTVNAPVPNIVGRTGVALEMATESYRMQQAARAKERKEASLEEAQERLAQEIPVIAERAGMAKVTPIGIAPAGEPGDVVLEPPAPEGEG